MYRNSFKILTDWKDNRYRKPLLIRGARQVGKSYLVEQFGRQYFKESFVKFDFEAQPELKKIFSGNLQPKTIIPQLELFCGQAISDLESLVFFDEIQSCPQALISLKYFFEQRPDLPIIAAGSLIEFAISEISFPVGRIKTLNIYPLSFFEFLLAMGKDKLADLILEPPRLLTAAEHQLMLEQYKLFLLIGGLPEAVKVFSETGSALQAQIVQKDLIKTYQADFSKYSGRSNIECLRQVFHSIPQKITKPVKYTHLSADFSVPTIKKAVQLLYMAQMIHKIPHTNPHGLPLGASASPKLFKLILLDIGLLHALSHLEPQKELLTSSLLDTYRGALAEQAVGQSLLHQTDGDIYTWYRPQQGSQAEVDYVIAREGQVIPIEVKSGKVARLKSLHQFLKDYQLAKEGYAISEAPYARNDSARIVNLPIYYADTFFRNIEP